MAQLQPMQNIQFLLMLSTSEPIVDHCQWLSEYFQTLQLALFWNLPQYWHKLFPPTRVSDTITTSHISHLPEPQWPVFDPNSDVFITERAA